MTLVLNMRKKAGVLQGEQIQTKLWRTSLLDYCLFLLKSKLKLYKEESNYLTYIAWVQK